MMMELMELVIEYYRHVYVDMLNKINNVSGA